MEVILTRNDIVFLVVYYTLIITLSSLIVYKIRYPFYKLCRLPPPSKMRLQTISVTFLLHLFMIPIAFAIMPSFDSYGNETEITVVIAFSLGVFLTVLYTVWYLVHHKLCAGLDFTIMLVLTMCLNIPLHHMEMSEELYFKAWISASAITYLSFIMVVSSVLAIMEFSTHIFPNSWEVLKEMWNGDEKKERR